MSSTTAVWRRWALASRLQSLALCHEALPPLRLICIFLAATS